MTNVSQGDRDAAADMIRDYWLSVKSLKLLLHANRIQDGNCDHSAFVQAIHAAEQRGMERAAKIADETEDYKVQLPCPDGIKGCAVYHFKTGGGPIATAIRNAKDQGL